MARTDYGAPMIQIDETRTRELLPWRPLVEAIRDAFQADIQMPVKHQHFVTVPGAPDGKLMMMPAWSVGEYIVVKVVDVFPGNSARGIPAVNGAVLLLSAVTGELLALIDGGEVTARRTAASSALAADYLAREDSTHLLLLGTGRVAGNLIEAHASVRPIKRVTVWGRDRDKAAAVADRAARLGFEASPTADPATAAGEADIVSSATLAHEPIIEGVWLRPGAHIDLVGNYSPTSREADDTAVRKATIFVDTPAALKATGDLAVPLKSGVLTESDIAGNLFDLTRGLHPGRQDADQITLFKSVGAAVEDFAAARLVYEQSRTASG